MKHLKDIRKGDKIKRADGSVHTVVTVVKINCKDNCIQLVELEGGLLVTPKHPVKINGSWIKPMEIAAQRIRTCSAVYNFVLDDGHIMEINGIECVTLGHGFVSEKVKHSYFGT